MPRKTEKMELAKELTANVKLSAKQLLIPNVPVKSYIKDPTTKKTVQENGKPKFDLYHVNIQFSSYEEILMCAIGKVKHTVGHAIKEKDSAGKPLINADGDPAGVTTVDYTGYPPESAIDTFQKLSTAAKAATKEDEKAKMRALLESLLKELK